MQKTDTISWCFLVTKDIDKTPRGEEPDLTLQDIADDVGVSVGFIHSLVNHERECLNCGHVWTYTGDHDRPTCPNCKRKNTQPVDEQPDQYHHNTDMTAEVTHWLEYGEPTGDGRVEATHRITYMTANETRGDDVIEGTLSYEGLVFGFGENADAEHVHDDGSLLLSALDDEKRAAVMDEFEPNDE